MAEFDDKTLKALQAIYEALLKLESGMLSLADAVGGSVKERVYRDYAIHPQRRALKDLDPRIWPHE